AMTVEADPEVSEIVLNGDIQLLTLALGALAQNAVDTGAMKMHLVARCDGDARVLLRLEDDGEVSWPDPPTLAIDPFFIRNSCAIGIGYSAAHLVASRHGGQLRVGPYEGGGTFAILELPMSNDTPVDAVGGALKLAPAARRAPDDT